MLRSPMTGRSCAGTRLTSCAARPRFKIPSRPELAAAPTITLTTPHSKQLSLGLALLSRGSGVAYRPRVYRHAGYGTILF